MIRYNIRAIPLLELVQQVKTGKLIPDAYFQRNLVWREVHKRDLIETVLKGYPFPQMFFSSGKIDVENMSTTSCIVDGQQRTNAILGFVDNEFAADGRYFKDLSDVEKAYFLKYEIAVVVLDLDNDSHHVREIFKRLNRTSNSLSIVEKLASEYSPTEYMYVAKLLAGAVNPRDTPQEEEAEEDWRVDPNLPDELIGWAKAKPHSMFAEVIRRLEVFTESELARKVHIMYVLNIMSTLIGGFFNRNDKTTSLLEDYKDQFPEKDRVCNLLNASCEVVGRLPLGASSFWTTKASFFSLVIAIGKAIEAGISIDVGRLGAELSAFAVEPDQSYVFAAREGVNNRKERLARHEAIEKIILTSSA